MPVTDDRNDPRLGYGVDSEPIPQHEVYLVLSDDERAKGFVRPLRHTYVHWNTKDGTPMPKVITSTANLKGCGAATKMADAIAETYAREPKFYGATYCVGCKKHLPVSEFTWEDGSVVGS